MKKNKFIHALGLYLIFTVLFCGLCLAQKAPKEEFDFPKLNKIKMPKVKEKTLDNGLRTFLVEDHHFPTIDIQAVFRTGSMYEPAEKIGLATMTGIVLRTGGTKKMTGDKIDKELETLAASIETSVGLNNGVLRVSSLKEDIDKVIPIAVDILQNPVFAQDKFDLAKLQLRAMIARRNDNVSQIRDREFQKIIYGAESVYARHEEYATIESISRDDLIAYHKRYFHPNNMMMTVWGDFKTKEMINTLNNTFGTLKPAELDIPPTPEVTYDYKNSINYIDKQDLNQSNILMGHIGGRYDNPDYPALLVMNQILTMDRMFKKIRSAEGLAYSVFGYYGVALDHPGIFNAGAQTKSESTVKAIRLMIKEIERMTQEEVSDEELKRGKDEFLNSYVFNFDSKAKIVNRMLTLAFFGYPLDFIDRIKNGVEKVTKVDVLRVAKEYMRPDKLQMLVVGRKQDFDEPLSVLGEVDEIDITIPGGVGSADPNAKAITLSAEELKKYEGGYSSKTVPIKITLTVKDEQLFAQAGGQPEFALTPFSKTEFRFEMAKLVIEFGTNDKGEVQYRSFTLKQGGQSILFERE
jgi:zinc protease